VGLGYGTNLGLFNQRDQTQKRQCRLLNVSSRLAIKIGCVNFDAQIYVRFGCPSRRLTGIQNYRPNRAIAPVVIALCAT